jgi:hypothetical protein
MTKPEIRLFVRAQILTHHANYCGCGASRDCINYEGDVRVAMDVALALHDKLDDDIENLTRYECDELEDAPGYFLKWDDVKALLARKDGTR